MHYSFIRYFRNSKQVQIEQNNHHTYATHMNTRIFRWKPNSEENHLCRRLSLQYLLLRKLLTTCTGVDSYQHAGTNLQKATTFTRLPAFPGRELLPPDMSTNFYWQKDSTFILKASTLRSTADHVSSIFKLDQTSPTQPFTCQ